MSDLNLFPDPTPSTPVAGAPGSTPAAGVAPATGAPSAAGVAPAAVAAGVAPAPTPRDLLDVLDELVVGLRTLGGQHLEERLGLVGTLRGPFGRGADRDGRRAGGP